jgi:hypothetical protein
MANTMWDSGKLILADVLTRADEQVGSDYDAIAKALIQDAYWKAITWAPWPWAKKYPPGVFQTVAMQDTLSGSVTKGSTAVVLSAVQANSVLNFKLYVNNEAVPYRIAAHTAGSANITLDAPYTEDTNGNCPITIFQDEYDITPAGSNGVIQPFKFWFRNRPGNELNFISKEEQDQRPWFTYSTNRIITIAMINDKIARVRPWTLDAKTIEFDYAERQPDLTFDDTAGDIPIIPREDRIVIAHIAAAHLCEHKEMFNKFQTNSEKAEKHFWEMYKKYIPKLRHRMFIKARRSIGS